MRVNTQIKKILIVFLILIYTMFTGTGALAATAENGANIAAADNLTVSADAAILMDAKTGQILFAKNPLKKRPPASTTKIMTALLALETAGMNDIVTVSKKAAYTEGSSMYLTTGEKLRVSDLLYGALMNSGNDACVALAEHIAGSTASFAELMNMKALSLGAVNTHFTNPHGLPDPNHYTCAYDLALIARDALKNQTFAQIVSTRSKIVDWPGQKWNRKLENTNKLLWNYIWADGIKTGTTSAAGQCLISSATKGNRHLISVVLHSGNRWQDSINMFEYGFNKFEYQQVAVKGAEFTRHKVQNGVQEEIPVVYASDDSILLPSGKEDVLEKRVALEPYPAAPIKKGEKIGSVSYYIKGNYTGQVDLIAGENVEAMSLWDILVKWIKIRLQAIF